MSTRYPAFLTIILLLLVSAQTWAGGKFNAVINGKSRHLNATHDWNEDNYGFGIEFEFGQETEWKKVLMANGFRDSTNNMSYMAGAGMHRRLYSTQKLTGLHTYTGLSVFLMTRKDVNANRPFPGLLPSITVENERFGLNLTYLPRRALETTINVQMVDPSVSGLLFVQFKINLDQLLP